MPPNQQVIFSSPRHFQSTLYKSALAPAHIWTLGLILVCTSLFGCSSARPAKDELTKTMTVLESVRKLGCAHDSLKLAEESYAKAQRLFDEKKYDEARAQASAARELAQEVADETQGKPCEVPPEPQAPPKTVELPTEDSDRAIEPFESLDATELKTVYFGFDASSLTADTIELLNENLEWIRAHPDTEVVVEGHCDSRGTMEYNMALSDRRAKSVAGFYKSAGVEERRLEPVGLGSHDPASLREDAEGHRLNRRVEFKLKK